jgi:hypothetical protein
MSCDLRSLLAGRDRSCPPPTSGFRYRADPARTSASASLPFVLRTPVVEAAQVKWPGVSVADRGELEVSCWNGTDMARPVSTTAPPTL